MLLDSTLERSCTIARIISGIGDESLGRRCHVEFVSGFLDALLEALELDVDDLLDIFLGKGVEEYLLVDSVDEFRRKRLSYGLFKDRLPVRFWLRML